MDNLPRASDTAAENCELGLAEGELAAADVGVEMVGAFGGFGDGAEEAALAITKGFGIDFAGGDGGGDMAVVLGVDDIDRPPRAVEVCMLIARGGSQADFDSRC